MDVQEQLAPAVGSTEEWREETRRLSARTAPTFVHLRAQLPIQGRTNQILAATSHLSVVLKTYASGGENGLHAHTNEDHVFLILQGGATFHGPNGEARHVARNDCVLVPRDSLYWFAADEGAEPLVMARIGATVDASKDVLARVDQLGAPFDGASEANKEVPLILGNDWFA